MKNFTFIGAIVCALIAGTAHAQAIGGLPPPHVANNTALQALSTKLVSTVIRDGYKTVGDAPPQTYVASGAPCSLASGNGDGGFQVKSADNKCWLIAPQQIYDVREWGMTSADGNGTINGPALTNIAADTGSHTFFIPNQTFLLPCSTYYTMASSISFTGTGKGTSILQFLPNCVFPTTPASRQFFLWQNRSRVNLTHFTVDLNNGTNSSSADTNTIDVLSFQVNGANVDGLLIDDVSVLNGNQYMAMIDVGVGGNYTYSNVNILNNTITQTPSHNYDLCIQFSTLQGQGFIPSARIQNNTCYGADIQFDGAYTKVVGNDVSNFAFGAGINGTSESGTTPSNYGCLISNNFIHDSAAISFTGNDSNNTSAEGLENECVSSTVTGNYFYHLGGQGVQNYATNANYVGNYAVDTGGCINNGTPCAPQAGFVNWNVGSQSQYAAANVTFTGNFAFDDNAFPSNRQLYGFLEKSTGFPYNTTFRANHFTGPTQGESIPSADTLSHDAGYIQSSVAASAADIHFTGLDTASYHRWRLTCVGLVPSVTASVGIQIAEAGTFQTTAFYHYNENDSTSGTITNNAGNNSIMLMGLNTWTAGLAAPGNFSATFGDLSGTSGAKVASFTGGYETSGGNTGPFWGMGFWGNDNNAINGIRVVPSTGTISGTCTLEGYPQ